MGSPSKPKAATPARNKKDAQKNTQKKKKIVWTEMKEFKVYNSTTDIVLKNTS